MIKGIGHVAYNVQDMEKSMAFYCGVLGFERAFTLRDDDGNPWIEYLKITGGQFLELFYHRPVPAEETSYAHLCLTVEDIQAAAEHLRKNGIRLDVEPNQGKDTNWQCWVRDPDGNRIELMQMNPASPQSRA